MTSEANLTSAKQTIPKAGIELASKTKNKTKMIKDLFSSKHDLILCYLDSFFITYSSNDLDTDFCSLWKVWMANANVSEDFDHSFPYADASILPKQNKTKQKL